MKKSWHVYMVRCSDGSLYTGITKDLTARVACHNSGDGAKYTRSRKPVSLAWSGKASSESAARKREAEIKGWTRERKLVLAEKKDRRAPGRP